MKISPLRIAFSALASLAMATSANAASLQFFQQNLAQTPIVSSNPSSGTTTLTTTGPGAVGAIPPGWIQVQILLEGQIQTQPAFMSFTTALTSGGAASTSGTSITQDGYTGTIQFRSLPTTVGSINYLTAQFNGGLLTGTAGGNSANFSASAPPSTVTFTSDVPQIQAAINTSATRNFSLALSGLTQALSVVNGTVGPFNASISGTFSVSPIPEPSSLVMAGIPALLGLGFVGFRRRSMAS